MTICIDGYNIDSKKLYEYLEYIKKGENLKTKGELIYYLDNRTRIHKELFESLGLEYDPNPTNTEQFKKSASFGLELVEWIEVNIKNEKIWGIIIMKISGELMEIDFFVNNIKRAAHVTLGINSETYKQFRELYPNINLSKSVEISMLDAINRKKNKKWD